MRISLPPGQGATVNVFLGTAKDMDGVRAALQTCRRPDFVSRSSDALKSWWDRHLAHFSCGIPDAEAQRQINIWNPCQAQRNFLFSRNISYYSTGTFRGVGFRDTAQDVLAQTPLDNPSAQQKLRELFGQQYQDGHTNHYYFPTEGWDPLKRLHSDNHIWPILGVWNSVMEAGSAEFLEEKVPFFDGGQGTVYDHLFRAVAFAQAHLGANGFPLMLTSDWNDMLYKVCRQGRGSRSTHVCRRTGKRRG
ncbi:MAG: hypothetical protein A3K19_26500 [Lentisphaerae bacterium RIFOXYB12_FULL_65_16]|nr:MAG: hypothetical protein A3K18_08670 [Lentisphaerae bacterium RIFOXYA12_64_32]OGV87825.1 MAG: hypothetical protein A3K19_26500 [Lentisphaerae bacterium RIFOXYB12_FULL_65_16]